MNEYLDPEFALPTFAVMAIAFLALSFVIVLWVKAIPNKLLLLGLLMAVVSVGFGAFLSGMRTAAVIMLTLAVVCILAGIVCILISHIVRSIRSSDETKAES
jgi:uncharacterized membrane protein YfcA